MAGVSIGTGAINSLLVKLTTLLSDKYKLLTGIRKQIDFLKRELGRMQILLETLAGMEKLDGPAKGWRDNVRDLSYDMEDCIDRFMDRLGNGGAKPKFMKRTARRLKTLWARHDIATQIKELKARVMEESERRGRYKLDENYYSATRTVEIDPWISTLHEEVKGLVAMDDRVKQVTALLMDESMELKVVPIVGSGGLGKTTLAMEVFRKVGKDFECRASVSVSRSIDLQTLLKDILSQIDDKGCQSEGWNINRLSRKTTQILNEKRYFIVVDDVWKEQDWKLVKAAFPENNNGSRIIATTRITGVANQCCSNSGGQPYQMVPLDDDASRKLFFKRIFSSDDPCPSELEEVSTRILRKCGGLPLAIVTFASLLANKTHKKKDEWERLQDSIGTGPSLDNDGNLKEMNNILLLSYWDLPHHLKTCLLYLCIYPEDYKINCEELKWKWMAEGFLDRRWGRLDEVAENCINELVNRNMIQPIDIYDNGIVKYCRVHDMVLDLIISLSDEENFATVLNGRVRNSCPRKIRRLSVQASGGKHQGAVCAVTETKLHVRSLTTFCPVEQIPHLVDFHALRVLDLFGCKRLENKHVKHIGSSRQLRYLRIGRSRFTELPGEIGKLQHLETLDLRHCYSLTRLPSTVAQLQKLVRLFVSNETQLRTSGFRSLQALEELRVHETDDPVRFAEEVNELGKCNLRYLYTNAEIAERLFCNPCLQVLKIWPQIGMVPKGMASLKNLVKLSIMVQKFDNEGLQVLMGMPSMAHLQLCVTGVIEKLTVGSNGFKLLKVLQFKYTSVLHPAFLLEPTNGLRLTFEPDAVAALRQLRLDLSAMWVVSDFFAYLGAEHFSGLAHLEVEFDCYRAAPAKVEALESSIEKAINLHSDCEIRVRRVNEHGMFKDEKEWEEAIAEDRKRVEKIELLSY